MQLGFDRNSNATYKRTHITEYGGVAGERLQIENGGHLFISDNGRVRFGVAVTEARLTDEFTGCPPIGIFGVTWDDQS